MKHRGRPLYSRRLFGYGGDLAALARLRRAVLGDDRITTQRYTSISDAIGKITRSLAPFKARAKAPAKVRTSKTRRRSRG